MKNGYRAFIERAGVTHVNKKYMDASVWTVRLSRYDIALSGFVNVKDDLSLDTMVCCKFDQQSNQISD